MNNKQKEYLMNMIAGMVTDKVDEIFLDAQAIMDIKYGDEPIDYALSLITAKERLTKLITEMLIWQKMVDKRENN